MSIWLNAQQVEERRRLRQELSKLDQNSAKARQLNRQLFQLESIVDGRQVIDVTDLIEKHGYEEMLEQLGFEKLRRIVERDHSSALADQILEELREEELPLDNPSRD